MSSQTDNLQRQNSQNDRKSRKDNNSNVLESKNIKKYLLDLGDGEKAELYYPTLPNFNNPYDINLSSIKNIFIMVDPTKIKDGPNESLCKSILGLYTDVVFDIRSEELKVIIQGFVPNGPCYKHKRLKIGDLLISINDFYINAENIESLLSAIKQPKCIKLSIQSAIKFIKISDVDDDDKYFGNSIKAVSKNTDIVKGDRIKELLPSFDIPHSLMILSLQDEKIQDDSSPKIDLLYKFPANNDLFVTIRGMFITLAGTIHDIDNCDVRSCTIRFNGQTINVSFIVNINIILVIAVPQEYIDAFTLNYLTNDLKSVIEFSYENLRKSLKEKNYKKNFDNLFSLFFQRLLLKNDLINMKSMKYNDDLKMRIFNAIPWFELSNQIKVNIDLRLSTFEAQEFIDADGLYYKNRRLFNIIGCCLFFKTYLISTHLNVDLTKKIYKFCDNNGLLILSSNIITNQFFIWKEIFIRKSNNFDKNIKNYILIVGYREFIFATIIEFGCISRSIDNFDNIQPDPYLIEQAKIVLLDMMNSDMMRDINDWYSNGSLPHITNIDKVFNTQKERNASLKNRPRSNLANQYIKDAESNKKLLNNNQNKNFKKGSIENIAKPYENLCVFNQFPESSIYDSVFHYVHSEENSNGILISPLKRDNEFVDSLLYMNVMNNFTNCCIKIKKFFDLQEKNFNPYFQNNNNNFIEQGILFTLQKLETRSRSKSKTNENDNKRSSSVENLETNDQNILNYWVVGRRELKNTKKDFFICFHDTVQDIVQEIAFDIGFSRFSF